ncbi:hypothetical protein E2F46_14210 [Luteimonas aestuarii]|uniref:CheB-type methylesterase domain-containing protein n=1 Tax=Luteimonas aestuarii TaxID=453837 RepID=A0A4R5TNL9_9GAMM|nr:chemotaxis protein CheB [Luteimonas aestuarii]TDK21693.1 hypothetical protein E2F46_14210 [Luteimonas aestuarii]
MNDGTLRVALLARAGDACDRIGEALRGAGADLVLVADPVDAGESAVRDARPQAIMVALEPAIEDALEAFDDLLADPAYLVIFEEAELAAQRAGWDAARWMRHLSAKLHRHGDVLPPGAEDETDLQPSPGPLPSRRDDVDLEEAIVAFADEAQQRAEEVPRDSGIEGSAASGGVEAASPFDPLAWETGGAPAEDLGTTIEASADTDAPLPFDPVAFELADADAGALPRPPAAEPAEFDLSGFSLAGDASGATPGNDADVDGMAEAGGADASANPAVADAVEFDLSGFSLVDDAPGPSADGESDRETGEAGQSEDAGDAAEVEEGASQGFDTGGLSLAADEDIQVAARNDGAPAVAERLDARISGLSLADPESYGHGPERGAVLVDAGLGGPDAVRQLLAAMPPGFPRTVLVRLQLDGGRYDRLVRQMERAAALPVELASANAEAVAGQVYFLPPELGLRRDKGRLWFDADAAGQALPDALPAGDSALLLLSGASRSLADAAGAGEWSAALVAGQAPDGSYDPDASLALMERGGITGTPGELAAMLAERWPPPGAAGPDLEELQP